MEYRIVTTSVAGFVQQLAVSYISNGYWFYVMGTIPERKDPTRVDAKLIAKYDIAISKWTRARRKRHGLANMQYLRYERTFILIATKGRHRFFEDEASKIRDVRRRAIRFAGYRIGYRLGSDRKRHASVRIAPVEYSLLKSYCLDLALGRSAEGLRIEFERIRFEPYAPVRRQLLNILGAVNRARQEAGYEPVPYSYLRLHRKPLAPFVQDRVGINEGFSNMNSTRCVTNCRQK